LGKSCGWGVIYIVDTLGRQLHVSDRAAKPTASTQLSQQTTQLQQMQDQLSKATTVKISIMFGSASIPRPLYESNNPQLIRSQLLSEIAQAEKKLRILLMKSKANARLLLVKMRLNTTSQPWSVALCF